MAADTPVSFRENIAKVISLSVIISSGALGVLGVLLGLTYIFKVPGEAGLSHARELLQYIFSSLLPLWGTWIGTVLAYYFSKENFEAANKQVRDLVSQVRSSTEQLNAVNVTQVMMPLDKMKRVDVPAGGSADQLDLKTMYDNLVTQNIRRALIFKDRKIIYVLHKSLLSDFLFRNQSAATSPPSPPLTVASMKTDNDKDVKNAFANGVATVSKSATMLDVKNLMDNLAGCQDVFVTDTGKRDEEVLGWISNVDVMEKGKLR